MPNRFGHIRGAIPCGIGLSIATAPQGTGPAIFWETLGGAVGAVPGAVPPDIMDDANCPNHGSIAHGIAPTCGLAYFAWKHLETAQSWLRTQAD